MSARAKLWYVAAAVWALALLIALAEGRLVAAGAEVIVVIVLLVVAAES